MAKKPSKQSAEPAIPAEFDAEAYYRVRVARRCQAFETDFSPAFPATVKGKVAEALREFLSSAEAV